VIRDGLQERELELLIAMLFNREKVLAFNFLHCGTIITEVAPLQEIRTVLHRAWQVLNFLILKALVLVVINMLRERIKNGLLKYCHGLYRNPWFLIKKAIKGYRLINAAMEMNRVTIRDANLPLQTDEFAKEFVGN